MKFSVKEIHIFGVFFLKPPLIKERFVVIRALYMNNLGTKLICMITSDFKAGPL